MAELIITAVVVLIVALVFYQMGYRDASAKTTRLEPAFNYYQARWDQLLENPNYHIRVGEFDPKEIDAEAFARTRE